MNLKFETEIKIDKILTSSDINKGQKRLVEIVKEKSDPYVPWLTGRLRNEVRTSKQIITYKAFNGGNKSYARKQFYTNRGLGKEGYNNGGKRGNKWHERMWNEHQEEIESEIKDILLGGK